MNNSAQKKIMIGSTLVALSLGVTGLPALAAENPGTGMMGARSGRTMERGMPGLVGTVTAKSGTILTITDLRSQMAYTVETNGATFVSSGAAAALSDITVGDQVMIQGTVTGTSVSATKVVEGGMGMTGGRGMNADGTRPVVAGSITGISGSTLTITTKSSDGTAGKTYTIDVTNATVRKANADSTVSALALGDTVAVQGTLNGTTVTATRVDAGMMGTRGRGGMNGDGSGASAMALGIEGNGKPVVMGTVASVSGTSFTITNNGGTYTIDATVANVVKRGVSSASVASITVGDVVTVQGTVSGTTVTASSVIDQTPAGENAFARSSAKNDPQGFMGRVGNFFSKLFGF